VLPGQDQVSDWGFLAFLDEAVQKPQLTFEKAKQNACDTIAGKSSAHFPQALAHCPTQGHADRPAKLHPHKVFPHYAAVLLRQSLQPFPNRLIAAGRSVEDEGGSLRLFFCHYAPLKILVPQKIHTLQARFALFGVFDRGKILLNR
jgi:hypothetical protein